MLETQKKYKEPHCQRLRNIYNPLKKIDVLVVKFPWITFLRVKKLEEFGFVSRHLVYTSVTEQWLVEDTLPQECCRENFCWQKKSAQSISHAAFRGHCCRVCVFYIEVFCSFWWMLAKLRFGYEFLSLP